MPSAASRRFSQIFVAFICLFGLGLGNVLSFAAPANATENEAPSSLITSGLIDPQDVGDLDKLTFSWHVNADKQNAYQILVGTGREELGNVWDSGRVESAEQTGVAYTGPVLEAGSSYYWSVRIWDSSDTASSYAEPVQFGTAPTQDQWGEYASAIWADTPTPEAPDPDEPWSNYALETTLTVNQVAVGILVRTSGSNAFMQQIRAVDNQVAPHTRVNGTFTELERINLEPGALAIGKEVTVRIEVNGQTVRTLIDGTEVDVREVSSMPTVGTVGFRTGSKESATVSALQVIGSNHTELFTADFTTNPFPGGSVSGGKYLVGNSADTALPLTNSGPWSEYTLETELSVTATALGVMVRSDENNGFMMQVRAADNQLAPHTYTNGQFAQIERVDLPTGTLQVGRPLDLSIEVKGQSVTTSIDGTVVDERVVANIPTTGKIGFRTGGTESGTVFGVRVTDATSEVLFEGDFASKNPFTCGSISGGEYRVGTGSKCMLADPNQLIANWSFLRTEVTTDSKPITSARLYATAGDFRGHSQYAYKAFINGTFVGLGPTNRVGTENRFDGFDVTHLLNSGEANAIAALAYSTNPNNQRFIASLIVDYADGTSEVFGSNEEWKGLAGSNVYPEAGSIGTGYYKAPVENLQMDEYPEGFDTVGFDDSQWLNVAAKPMFTELVPTPMAKVTEQLREPVTIIKKGEGNYFIDFGRTWIGGISYKVTAPSAGTVDIRFGETTSAENTVKYSLNTGNKYQDIVTLKEGEQTVETWGMRVFRYVEIVGAPEPITAENLSALALVYPFNADSSEFVSSDDNLNQVYRLAKNSIESLNVNFYTDSWTRERVNYEADAYLQLMSTLYLMDDLSLGRYSMNYFKNNRTWPTEWPIYVILAVHDAWQQTGDLRQVEDYYDNLVTKSPEKWLDADTGLIRKTFGSDGSSSSTDRDIVDWPTSQRDDYQFRQYNTVVNALSYRSFRDMAAMAQAIGRDDDYAKYTQMADRLRDSMNTYLYDADKGAYDDGMDGNKTLTGHFALHASAFALAFGVPEDSDSVKVADYVAEQGMKCSVYCAGFSITGLFNGGAADAAVGQLTDEGTSSWMNMIKLGAGSTMEAWDPSQKGNLTYSHPWAASPAFHVPSGLFGIKPTSPGYETFRIAPQPGGTEWASIRVPTVKGSAGAAFDHEGEAMSLVALVPGNTTAEIVVPVPEGTETVYVNGEETEVSPNDGLVTLEDIGVGCHLVTLSDGTDQIDNPNLTRLCTPQLVGTDPEPTDPQAPSEADLVDSLKGAISVPESAKRGETIIVEVNGREAGTKVNVWLHSDPELLVVGELDEDQTIQATIPATAEITDHRISVTDEQDQVVGWDTIAVRDSGGPGPGPGPDPDPDPEPGPDGGETPDNSGSNGGDTSPKAAVKAELAASGASGVWPLIVAAALMLGGGLVIAHGRRKL